MTDMSPSLERRFRTCRSWVA